MTRSDDLAALVRQRRQELGLTQDDVKALGGPSTATQRKIERGVEASWRLQTLWPLEKVFGWEAGSMSRFLDGGDRPAVVDAVDYDRFRSLRDGGGSPLVQDEAEAAGDLLRADLNPDLSEFTDWELAAELHARMLFYASKLHAGGTDLLTVVRGPSGENIITSRPPRG